jgi:hypothetical protein
MIRSLSRWLAALTALAAIVTTQNGCSMADPGGSSTGAGNPGAPVSHELLYAVCGVINRCNPQVTVESCQNGVLPTAGFNVPLGLAANYSTMSSIIQGETSGALTGNVTAGSGCYDTINQLQCANAAVIAAYNPGLPNPFVNSPGMISGGSCTQTFTPGVNLEVPIELVDQGLSSLAAVPITFSRTTTSLNTADYDGTVSYAFEIVAKNPDSSARSVYLVDASGTTVATIPVPSQGASPATTRFSTVFTPTSGANTYRVRLDGTTSANQLVVFEGRIRVRQVGATQTKIYIPLMQGALGAAFNADNSTAQDDVSPITSYSQPNFGWYSLWQKNNAAFSQIASGYPWTFEAVLSTPTGTGYASIFDATTGLQVTDSEVQSSSTTPVLVSASFADAATNFKDQDRMQVEIKESGGGLVSIYKAGLWLKLTKLTHSEIYFRYGQGFNMLAGDGAQFPDYQRTIVDTSLFTAFTIYNQLLGKVASAGTSCTETLFDGGLNEAGSAGSPVSGSTLTLSSTTVTLQRSPALTITSGDRYIMQTSANPGPGACYPVNSTLVLVF